jgi:hypothetical protein
MKHSRTATSQHWQVANTTTDTTNPHATCTGPTKLEDTSNDPRSAEARDADQVDEAGEADDVPRHVSTSLEGERDGQATTDDADDPGDIVHAPGGRVERPIGQTNNPATVGTSETTSSRAVEADSPRPSEDPVDATDDDAPHPDKPTEPPERR